MLAAQATYPEGVEACDAVARVLEFYGVVRGVVKDPAFTEPWDDGEAAMDHFNKCEVHSLEGRQAQLA